MTMREAACACGDFRLTLEGDPMLVSACCCTRCQRRTGSFFGVTAYFRPEQLVRREGAGRGASRFYGSKAGGLRDARRGPWRSRR